MLPEVSGGRIGAAVDLGSTSVHLLVGRVVDHRIEPLADESVFLGLGAASNGRGALGREAGGVLVEALAGYTSIAHEAGATDVTFIGTEPLRRLADAARIVADIDAATGVLPHVISHEEEAFLTLVGVTSGRPVEHEILVVDIGGGSSEFVSVGPGRRAIAAGVRIGAAALTGRYVRHDPPTLEELAELRGSAREAVNLAPLSAPEEIVVVGGTASNLLKILPGGPETRILTRETLAAAVRIVAADPAHTIVASHLVKPARARILGAGAAIIEAISERFGVDRVRVSESGLREGTVLVVAHAGPCWRDRLEELAHGWVQ